MIRLATAALLVLLFGAIPVSYAQSRNEAGNLASVMDPTCPAGDRGAAQDKIRAREMEKRNTADCHAGEDIVQCLKRQYGIR